MRTKLTRVEMMACLSLYLLLAGCGTSSRSAATPGAGRATVAHLPGHQGLQYCINLRPAVLAPAGSLYVDVHSLSAYVTATGRSEPALEAIKGRYPGWDSPGTTVYQQAFTNTNTVWVEIDHNFTASGIDCIEIYGKHLKPSGYASFKNQMLVGYSYFHRGHGWTNVKLFKTTSGPYLTAYAPAHRPKH